MEAKRKFSVLAYGYGKYWVTATCAAAARARIAFRIFGYGYDGWEHENWLVEEVTK